MHSHPTAMSVRFGKEEVERSASILATRVISRLRDTFRVDLPLHRLFESPMVSALAERIETRLWAGGTFRTAGEIASEREEIKL
jgi:hypothetical protein